VIRLWDNAWAEFIRFLDYDVEIRRVICSANAIASLNTRYWRAIKAAATSRRTGPLGDPIWTSSVYLDGLPSAIRVDVAQTGPICRITLKGVVMVASRRKVVAALVSAGLFATVFVGSMPTASAAQDCQTIAASPGVYTQTTVEYSNHWSISNSPTNHGYNWYLKHTNGSIEDSGYATGAIGTKTEPANDYYMQIYNSGGVLQSFYVCYAVV
jgi:hypothetical protein